ncbi:MAG: HAMP domain-containing histidine kinase [Muribaculum sp.]|nr:HAMP domain-containing histidine kinase [Muribaculum sp.]
MTAGEKSKPHQKSGGSFRSLRWSLVPYIFVAMVAALAGSFWIGSWNNDAQEWYVERYADRPGDSAHYEIFTDASGTPVYSYVSGRRTTFGEWKYEAGYAVVSGLQFVLIPLWVIFCIGAMGMLFYKREMEKPIKVLTDASEKISKNCLDFEIEPVKENELGQLCRSFEHMRAALYENSKRTWSAMEGRKRLNAAFAHDMRTPLTVLKGYTQLLAKHTSDGKISAAKQMEILGMMEGQITRLVRYTQKMGAVQKLEDIEPDPHDVSWEEFRLRCHNAGKVLAKGRQVWFWGQSDLEILRIDEELVLEVYENLVSNAARYAASWINIELTACGGTLRMVVEDDGRGFTKEALSCAAEPFYREDGEPDQEHFGLGLYICRVLCGKGEGELRLENGGAGAKVTATFSLR